MFRCEREGIEHHVSDALGLEETVELINLRVERENSRRLQNARQFESVGLVHFEDGDVCVDATGEGRLGQQRRRDALGEIGPRRIGEYPQSVRSKHAREHVRCRGLAIRSKHEHDAMLQLTQGILEELWRELQSRPSGYRRPSPAQPTREA